MILVDTSVWVQHFRSADARLVAALDDELVLTHPYVIGELACGSLRNRNEILDLLGQMPSAPVASDAEALQFINSRRLMGRGICLIDVHLLASTALSDSATFWTHDKRLESIAETMKLAFGGG